MSTHSYSDPEYDSYVANHLYNNSMFSLLRDIIDLNKTIVFQDHYSINHPAVYYTYWNYTIYWAGYLTITIHSSTTTIPYAEVEYTYEETTWELRQTFDDLGSAIFPVLPAPNVQVRIGSTNLLESATYVVSITYHY